jgi:hypothetical protein
VNLDSHIPLGLIVSLTQEPASTPTRTEVLEQLRSIGASGKLTAAEFRVLEYLVDAWLAGHANEVTGKLIAADVFGKNLQTYDSRKDRWFGLRSPRSAESLGNTTQPKAPALQ